MNQKLKKLMRRDLAAMRKYLATENESALEEAYDIGRTAVAENLSILDLIRIHVDVREKLLWAKYGGKSREHLSQLVGNFLMHMISPYEAMHRGFLETNTALQERNGELAEEITERRRFEEALRASEQRYQTLIETANDVIFTLAPDGRFTALNHAFETLTGWPRKRWLGKPFAPLVHPDDAALAVERFRATLRGEPPEVWQYRVRAADGRYIFGEITLAREMKDGKPVGVFGIGRDITIRKQAEQALRELSNKIMHTREEERRLISRQLHDEVCQSLAAISVALATDHNGAGSPEYPSPFFIGTQRLLEGTMERVHSFASELRPSSLDELGLLPALRSHVRNFSERTGVRVRLRADPAAENLNGEQKTAVFRIAQEALARAAQYTRAGRVNISFSRKHHDLCMEIADNGKSPRAGREDSVGKKWRLDLLEMQERARLLNGTFVFKPEAGHGTFIRVTFPMSTNGQVDGKTKKRVGSKFTTKTERAHTNGKPGRHHIERN